MANCTCPTVCDCQNPNPKPGAVRLVSENCPEHNAAPSPDPECPIAGNHRNGAIDHCSKCQRRIEDSMGSDFGLCQDCWEAECSESWWRMADRFPGAVCLVEETESTPESE